MDGWTEKSHRESEFPRLQAWGEGTEVYQGFEEMVNVMMRQKVGHELQHRQSPLHFPEG